MKRNNANHSMGKTIDVVQHQRGEQSRSLSLSSDKNVHRYLVEREASVEPTMEELMQMNPLIERKMSGYRKRRYLRERNNFPQIKEEEENGDEVE
jgi:hypothetical protein